MGKKKTAKTRTKADIAYDHAVEVCNRILRELDDELRGWTPTANAEKED